VAQEADDRPTETPVTEELESRIKLTALLESRMSQMHSYHDHKETMAHAAVVVVLAYVGGVISIQKWPPEWVPTICASRDSVALAGAMAVWLFIHVYLRWQLRNRRVAALYVACLLKVLRGWTFTPPSQEDLQPYAQTASKRSSMHTWIDFLVPWPQARVPSDEGLEGYPTAMVEEYLRTKTGAVFAETLVTFGSILLGLILLARIWP
jgi:hypothetical protein